MGWIEPSKWLKTINCTTQCPSRTRLTKAVIGSPHLWWPGDSMHCISACFNTPVSIDEGYSKLLMRQNKCFRRGEAQMCWATRTKTENRFSGNWSQQIVLHASHQGSAMAYKLSSWQGQPCLLAEGAFSQCSSLDHCQYNNRNRSALNMGLCLISLLSYPRQVIFCPSKL